jgi:hypothetical protein
VLDETTQMLPDCKSRLLKAHGDLAAMIEQLVSQLDLTFCREINKA